MDGISGEGCNSISDVSVAKVEEEETEHNCGHTTAIQLWATEGERDRGRTGSVLANTTRGAAMEKTEGQ
jgi:hypothetical protein